MFRDEDDLVKEEIKNLLTLYTLEELFEINDIDDVEAVYQLYINGYIKLPEARPI